jgi:hypothetical protein
MGSTQGATQLPVKNAAGLGRQKSPTSVSASPNFIFTQAWKRTHSSLDLHGMHAASVPIWTVPHLWVD